MTGNNRSSPLRSRASARQQLIQSFAFPSVSTATTDPVLCVPERQHGNNRSNTFAFPSVSTATTDPIPLRSRASARNSQPNTNGGIVKYRLKEGTGKLLARVTRTVYEAVAGGQAV